VRRTGILVSARHGLNSCRLSRRHCVCPVGRLLSSETQQPDRHSARPRPGGQVPPNPEAPRGSGEAQADERQAPGRRSRASLSSWRRGRRRGCCLPWGAGPSFTSTATHRALMSPAFDAGEEECAHEPPAPAPPYPLSASVSGASRKQHKCTRGEGLATLVAELPYPVFLVLFCLRSCTIHTLLCSFWIMCLMQASFLQNQADAVVQHSETSPQ